MKTPDFLKNINQLELTAAAILILYIVLPINAPRMICKIIDGPVGMVAVFAIAVYLFFHANPLLAIIFIFAAYELMRRCASTTGVTVIMNHTPTQAKKDSSMKKMNPEKNTTLEEHIVSKMAPIGVSEPSVFMTTEFSPVADDVGTASMYK